MQTIAAAKQWSVDPSSCTANNGAIYHQSSNRSASYGSLALAAATLPIPQHVALKLPDQFSLIGKPAERLDVRAKVNGSAQTVLTYAFPECYMPRLHVPPFSADA
jgi:isoquinoline 1-oxidoreductase subunit beta